LAMLLIVTTSVTAVPLLRPATAQESRPGGAVSLHQDILLPPRVGHVDARATALHWGMAGADVERIMGPPAELKDYDGLSGHVRVLTYPAEPIATKVSICDQQVCAVRFDIAGVDDSTLPLHSRQVWQGMDRATVLRLLGAPADLHLYDRYDMRLEHAIFERAGQSDLSVFFIDGRVAAKRRGRDLPPDLLRVALPRSNDAKREETNAQSGGPGVRQVRVGMLLPEVQALFGAPKLLVHSTFKGRPVEYAIYQNDPSGAFGSFTFIDSILTEFASGGRMPLSQILNGG
jgi:hypothetical protein